jgi:hypothetical protein
MFSNLLSSYSTGILVLTHFVTIHEYLRRPVVVVTSIYVRTYSIVICPTSRIRHYKYVCTWGLESWGYAVLHRTTTNNAILVAPALLQFAVRSLLLYAACLCGDRFLIVNRQNRRTTPTAC